MDTLSETTTYQGLLKTITKASKMASNSIGDFFINIIPKFDKGKIAGGSSALGGLAGKAAGVTAAIGAAGLGMFKFTSGIAKQNAELARSAKYLGQTTTELLTGRNAFELAGQSAEEYDSLIKNILASREKIRRGEGPFGEAAMQGFNVAALAGNTDQAVNALKKRFETLSESGRLDLGATLGLSEQQIMALSQASKVWNDNMREGAKRAKLTKDEVERSIALEKENIKTAQAYRDFKRDIASEAFGGAGAVSQQTRSFLDDPEIRNTLKGLTKALSELTGVIVKFLGGTFKAISGAKKGFRKGLASVGLGRTGDEQLLAQDRFKAIQEEKTKLDLIKKAAMADGKISTVEKIQIGAQRGRLERAVSTVNRSYDVKVNITGSESQGELTEKINKSMRVVFEDLQERNGSEVVQ